MSCMSPYSMPLWTIFTKWPAPSSPTYEQKRKEGKRHQSWLKYFLLHTCMPNARHKNFSASSDSIHNACKRLKSQSSAGQFHMRNVIPLPLTCDDKRPYGRGEHEMLDKYPLKIRVIWWRLKWNIIQELLCCRIQRNYSQLKCMVRI